MANPLFPNFNGLIRTFGSSLARSSLRGGSSANPSSTAMNSATRAKARQLSRRIREAAAGAKVGSRSWARGGLNSLWDVMASAGQGPLGELVQVMLRPTGNAIAAPEQEFPAALELASSLIQRVATSPDDDTATQRAAEREAENRSNNPPPREFEYRQTEPRGRNVFGGPNGGYADDDPVITGEMIRVESSNVWAIGYRWNAANPSAGTLIVRYWEKVDGKKTAAGPTYAYDNVHPQVFKAFQIAASKGKFVWDRLRIRGSVTGHQYDYRLIGLAASGYVPRQAKRYGDARRGKAKDYYIPRSIQGRNGQTYRSELPARLLGSPNRGGPDRGQADGGTPTRGTPNRGR